MKSLGDVMTEPREVNRWFILMVFVFGFFVGAVVMAILMIRGLI
jgi:hypothetical protein